MVSVVVVEPYDRASWELQSHLTVLKKFVIDVLECWVNETT